MALAATAEKTGIAPSPPAALPVGDPTETLSFAYNSAGLMQSASDENFSTTATTAADA